MSGLMLSLLILLATLTYTVNPLATSTAPRPLAIWHGLGDSHSSKGMVQLMTMIKEMYPGIFIHSAYIEEDEEADRRAGFYGHIETQVDTVALQLASVAELQAGFDAIGFSQGGQFLRSYVERYNNPPVHNLITFGSQHMGISDIPLCKPRDFLCQIARRAAKGAVYSTWAQHNIIQAQYYRDPDNLETFLAANDFLTSLNNEVYPAAARNNTFAKNLASLNNLVLVIFTQDQTVVPKESAWFGSEAPARDTPYSRQAHLNAADKRMIPMRMQPLYVEDWIGLRKLDERGGIVFEACKGEHMHLDSCWRDIVARFVGNDTSF